MYLKIITFYGIPYAALNINILWIISVIRQLNNEANQGLIYLPYIKCMSSRGFTDHAEELSVM